MFKILVAKCVVTYLAICIRSGTEEDYSELAQVLEDISSYQRDVLAAVNKEKEQTMKKDMKEKKQSHEMRKSAMETLGSKCSMVYAVHVPIF